MRPCAICPAVADVPLSVRVPPLSSSVSLPVCLYQAQSIFSSISSLCTLCSVSLLLLSPVSPSLSLLLPLPTSSLTQYFSLHSSLTNISFSFFSHYSAFQYCFPLHSTLPFPFLYILVSFHCSTSSSFSTITCFLALTTP